MQRELVDVPVLEGPGPTIILAGGSLSDDHSNEVYSSLYHYAKKPPGEKPRVIVFLGGITPSPEARAAGEDDSLEQAKIVFHEESPTWKEILESYQLEPVLMPLTVQNYPTAAHDPANIQLLEDADAVLFGGGWQGRHLRCLLQDDGMDTPVMVAVRRLLFERGGVYFGTSAGTAIVSTHTYGTGISPADLRENRMIRVPLRQANLNPPANLDDYDDNDVDVSGFTHGIHLLPGWAVDTHSNERGRYGRNLAAMQNLLADKGLCVSGATAVAIRNGWMRAYGRDRAVLFKATDDTAFSAPLGEPFGVRDMEVFSLAGGDGLHIESGELVSAKPRVDEQSDPYSSHDILTGDEFPRLMDRLLDSTVASIEDESRESDPGYCFRIHKTRDTIGYEQDNNTPVSANHIRLEVLPTSR